MLATCLQPKIRVYDFRQYLFHEVAKTPIFYAELCIVMHGYAWSGLASEIIPEV